MYFGFFPLPHLLSQEEEKRGEEEGTAHCEQA